MDRSDITIRRATVEDAEFLTELGERTFMEAFGPGLATRDARAHVAKTYSISRMSSDLAEPRSIFLIASMDGEPAGYAMLCVDARHDCVEDSSPVELVRFYALKKYWGREVGPALMEACLDAASREGCSTIWLSSWKLNDRGNAFYAKWGFEVVGEQPFVVGEDAQEDFILARTL